MIETKKCNINEPKTTGTKLWPYQEYYIGGNDDLKRRKGYGENHWSGAQSLETYSGSFLHDTMHGVGEYRWRFQGEEGSFTTYEGYFYSNDMHGYGVMSFDDGRVFKGLYYENVRWGPGVVSHACLRADVGLWRGKQLMRLAWMPPVPAIPDLNSTPDGRNHIQQYRIVLSTSVKKIGEVNSALDLLKRKGYDPVTAPHRWLDLYAKTCIDYQSVLCHREVFDKAYYGDSIQYLSVADKDEFVGSRNLLKSEDSSETSEKSLCFYAWNNNPITIHMMCHTYRHEQHRFSKFNLANILSGPRNTFKPAAEHELDCRTFLLACYIGNVDMVTQYIVDGAVYCNLSDLQGNTALMYATAGNQTDLMHFLVEAGADVNWYNDACVTPLGVALLNYLAVQCDVPHLLLVESVIPPPGPETTMDKDLIFDWNITRERPQSTTAPTLPRSTSIKRIKSSSMRKIKSSSMRSFMNTLDRDATHNEHARDHPAYTATMHQYDLKLSEIYNKDLKVFLKVPNLFEFNDILKDVKLLYDDQKQMKEDVWKKSQEGLLKKRNSMKFKTSKIALSRTSQLQFDERAISAKKTCMDHIMLTIKQLLDDGADPKLVCSPEPALVIAIAAESPALAQCLIDKGEKVNVVYHQFSDYTPLDLVLSRPLSDETFDLTKIFLESGAKANNRCPNDVPSYPGPTLLHVIIGKPFQNETQEILRRQMITLLLNYGCDPSALYMGRSAIEVAMTKRLDLLNVFIQNPNTDLNAPINDSNQTILAKMFNLNYFKTIDPIHRKDNLMNLLLFGADPLLECTNVDTTYPNLFVYIADNVDKIVPKTEKKPEAEPKTDSKKEHVSLKTLPKVVKPDNSLEYTLAMNQVADCVRMLHVRWIQGKLMKELLDVVVKYKHRSWHLIMKEFHNKKNARLWLNTERCLQIWDIFKKSKKKVCSDNHVLKQLLSIVYYFNIRHHMGVKLTFKEKEKIDADVSLMMRDHKDTSFDYRNIHQDYVKPELFVNAEKKFTVCFDCYLPLEENPVTCKLCKLLSFCNYDCMKENCQKVQDHPCTKFLLDKYFTDAV